MTKGYTEYHLNKRKEEGADVNQLLLKAISGDGQSPLQIAIHAASTIHKFAKGQENPELDIRSLELPVDPNIDPSEQVLQAYQTAIDYFVQIGEKHNSLDDVIIHPFNKKEVPLWQAIRSLHSISSSTQAK